MLFKVGKREHMEQMRAGLLYMNSARYFSTLEEASGPMRCDRLEQVYGIYRPGVRDGNTKRLEIQIGVGEGASTFDLGDQAVITASLPDPKNVVILSMSALVMDGAGNLEGEVAGTWPLAKESLELGDTVLIITHGQAFFDRIGAALACHSKIYGSPFLEGSYGLVDYVDFDLHSGHIGLFRKDVAFAWQREFRVCFYAKDEALNAHGALEFRIADLSDITMLASTRALVDEHLQVKKRWFKLSEQRVVQVDRSGRELDR